MTIESSAMPGKIVDPVLRSPELNASPGPEYAASTRRFQGIPGIERAGNGRLWATWYAGGPDEPWEGPGNYVVLATKSAQAKDWSSPCLIIDIPGQVRAFDPCLWIDPDERLWLFWAQSDGGFDGRAGVWAIVTDQAEAEQPAWSPPQRICDGIMMNKPTALHSGEWLLPVALWNYQNWKHPAVREEDRLAFVVASADRGKTWERRGGVDAPERTYDEHMLVEKRDGSLWMLIRTKYGIAETFSRDGGRSWSVAQRAEIEHVNSRFYIRRLESGKLILITHNPPDREKRSHLTARLSGDDGETWSQGLVIDERFGVSYPDATQAPDGTIYLIYDFERQQARQILMAVFTEGDVQTGKWKSRQAKQRVLIDQATG